MLQDEFWKQQADICPQRKLQYQWFTYTAAKVKKLERIWCCLTGTASQAYREGSEEKTELS